MAQEELGSLWRLFKLSANQAQLLEDKTRGLGRDGDLGMDGRGLEFEAFAAMPRMLV
jgi:hypothetical protein